MSALPRPTLTLTQSEQPSPEQTIWIALPRAAVLLDVSEGHLRRVCADELASKGAAKQIKPEAGGRPVWHIHCSYDARLAREHVTAVDEKLGEIWASATQAQRDTAMGKAEILIAFRELIGNRAVEIKTVWPSFEKAIASEHGKCPTERTLYRWNEQAPPSSSPIAVAASLIDARGRGAEQVASEAAIEFFRSLYLTAAKMSVAQCHRMVEARAIKEGWAWPSLRTAQANLNKWVDEQQAVYAREGKDEWRRKFLTPIHQDPDAFQAGECWEGDHSPHDLFIRVPDGKGGWKADRPSLTCWVDRRSRRLVGWHIGMSPNSESIRAALLRGFRDESVYLPAYAVMDNGKDFASEAIGGLTKKQRRDARNPTAAEREENEKSWGGVLGVFGIEARFNNPYNKDGKGRVERLMRTVHEDFDRTVHSYCGSDKIRVAPEHIKSILANVMDLPTLEQIRTKFAEWVEWYNHRDQHNIESLTDQDGITKLSPAAFYEAFIFRRSQLRDPKILALLEVPWSRELKVNKYGVSMKIAGRTVHYGGGCPIIKKMVGQSVRVSFDPQKMRRVTVWTTDLRFLAVAEINSAHGGFTGDEISREALKSALRRQRDERKRISTPIDQLAITGDALSVAADEQRKLGRMREQSAEAERRGKRKIEDMPPVRLVSTGLDEQAEAAERAARSRKVAGMGGGSGFDELPDFTEVYGRPVEGPSLAEQFGVIDEPDACDESDEYPALDDASLPHRDDFGDAMDSLSFRTDGRFE